MGLDSEPFDLGKTDEEKVRDTLWRHGACPCEIAMLLRLRRRVELNAMTSDQFLGFLERRLAECGARKVIPDAATMEKAWRRNLVRRRMADAAELIRVEAERDAAMADIPPDLDEQVRRLLADDPSLSWDQALAMVLD
jgi:hypothetical protein